VTSIWGKYAEAVRHPLAKKVRWGTIWGAVVAGPEPHFYVGLLWSLEQKYSVMGAWYPPIPDP